MEIPVIAYVITLPTNIDVLSNVITNFTTFNVKHIFCQLLRIFGSRKEKYMGCGVLLRVSGWES
jgi:hypothetical protein